MVEMNLEIAPDMKFTVSGLPLSNEQTFKEFLIPLLEREDNNGIYYQKQRNPNSSI